MSKLTRLALNSMLLLLTTTCLSATLYVPSEHPTIQDAVNAASNGDLILIADGVYTGPGNRDITLLGKEIEIASESGPDFCTIDCDGTNEENHRAFHLNQGETINTKITGLKVVNGNFTGSSQGGAVRCDDSGVTIDNCHFVSNIARYGGAISVSNSRMDISNSLIEFNVATETGLGTSGGIDIVADSVVNVINTTIHNNFGGIACKSSANTCLIDCVISSNYAYEGGGLYVYRADRVLVQNCDFLENTANYTGGAIFANCTETNQLLIEQSDFTFNSVEHGSGQGGAIQVIGSNLDVKISDSSFFQNWANNGGATGITSGVIDACVFQDNISVRGGALYFPQSSANIFNSLFCGNHAELGGAIYLNQFTGVISGEQGKNNTFSDNHAGVGADLFGFSSNQINSQFNHFTGNCFSDYYVSDSDSFNLHGCTNDLVLTSSDLFVSPRGDNANDGLTPESALQSINKALQIISVSSNNPRTITLAPGRYSPSTTGDDFPLPLMDGLSIIGTKRVTEVNAEFTATVFQSSGDQDVTLRNLKITNGGYITSVQSNSSFGGGLYCQGSSIAIESCYFTQNRGRTGVFFGGSTGVVSNSQFLNNEAYLGGGVMVNNGCAGFTGLPVFTNCLISGNIAENGGALNIQRSSPHFQNCTFAENYSPIGGALCLVSDEHSEDVPSFDNCIFWGNSVESIWHSGDPPVVEYSLVQEGFPGAGNIDGDPNFTQAGEYLYCLSQISAGQSVDSPCVNTGSDLASSICFDDNGTTVCLDFLATRTDQVSDNGVVDMGFHYPPIRPLPSLDFKGLFLLVSILGYLLKRGHRQ